MRETDGKEWSKERKKRRNRRNRKEWIKGERTKVKTREIKRDSWMRDARRKEN